MSGVAVALAAAGAVLVYFGIRNVDALEGARELAGGKLPAGRSNNPLKFVGVTVGNAASGLAAAMVNAAGGGYKLGAVKPHVATAANYLGPKFGIKTIYGWATGLYDHPKGLALDFMIDNLPNGKAVGQALADFAVANAATLRLTYVIWNRRIWSVARAAEGWRPYSGDSTHEDHVHLSFAA